LWVITIIAINFILGLIIHHSILPIRTPNYNHYFKIGLSFKSKLEGVTKTIEKLESGQLTTEIAFNAKSKRTSDAYPLKF